MDADEPSDVDRRIAQLRDDLDKTYGELIAAIREALDAGEGPSRIARHARWTREYISKIRDGEAGKGVYRQKRS